MKLKKKQEKAFKKVAICGKGITFDSGGLSLKPSESMIVKGMFTFDKDFERSFRFSIKKSILQFASLCSLF